MQPSASSDGYGAGTQVVDSLLYHVTMVDSEVTPKLCYGSFTQPGAQEIVRARTDGIELCRFDTAFNCITVVSQLPLFATVHNIATVPYPSLSGTSSFPDAIAVTSDSGTLTLMRFVVPGGGNSNADVSAGEWEVMDRVTLGRSGFRVSGAGHYLAVDQRSRAIFVAAPMKQKLVFPLVAGEASERGVVRFQSGLDASRPCIVFDCCALEVSADQNTLFAVLESELGSSESSMPMDTAVEKFLSFYEFSASLNTVTRLMSFRVPNSAHALIPVPADSGPGGVLICADGEVIWESPATHALVAQQSLPPPPIKTELPRRSDYALQASDPMIVAFGLARLQKRFFLLIQNELGDLYRVEVNTAAVQQHYRGAKRSGGGAPSALASEPPLVARYFDTIPPVSAMVLFKKGYLFCASETAPHAFYRVSGDGTASNTMVKRVRMPIAASAPSATSSKGTGKATLAAPSRYITLIQRHFSAESGLPELRNLTLLQTIPNSNQTVGLHTGLDAQQRLRFVRLSGRSGQHSAMHTVRYGLSTTLNRSVELPLAADTVIPLLEATSLFPTPGEEQAAGAAHNRILFSSPTGTLVIRFGDQLQVDQESGFDTTLHTLAAATIAEGRGCIQVHTRGIALLRAAGSPPVLWSHHQQKLITAADCSNCHIVAGFDNGGLMSFDLGITGQDFTIACTQPTFNNVRHVSVPPRAPFEFCVVATANSEVSVLQTKTLKAVDVLRCPVDVSSLLITCLDSTERLFVFVGLADGRLLKVEVDPVTGKRLTTSAYNCGTLPTRVSRGDGTSYCLVASSEVWRCYTVDGAFRISPVIVPSQQQMLHTTPIYAAAHRKGQRFDMLLSTFGKTLTMSSINVEEHFTNLYSVASCPLTTVMGRKLLAHPTRPNVMVALCTEYRGYNPSDMQQLVDKEIPVDVAMAERSPNRLSKHVSCLHLFDANQNTMMPPLYLNDGEAALSCGIGAFPEFGKEPVLVVGCANRYDHGHGVRAASWSETCLRTYRFAAPPLSGPEGVLGTQATAMPRLELVHVTILPHNDLPSATHVCTSGGFLLLGLGGEHGLHMYTWGLKRLLWKRKLLDTFRSRIVSLDTVPDTTSASMFTAAGYSTSAAASSMTTLILCGLQDQSVMIARYLRGGSTGSAHALITVAVDPLPRFVTTSCFMDDRTIAVADRFGSLVVLRIPPSTRFDLPEHIDALSDGELIEATSFRSHQPLEIVNAFHVGQTITTLQPVVRPRVPGITVSPTTVLIYGTVLGKVGALLPFPCEEDAALGAYLDPILSEYFHSPVDRPLNQHRSRMTPKRSVVDGDSLHLLAQSKQVFLTTEAKIAVEERVEKFRNVEATHRKLLDLPPRNLISIHELSTKMKALIGLSE